MKAKRTPVRRPMMSRRNILALAAGGLLALAPRQPLLAGDAGLPVIRMVAGGAFPPFTVLDGEGRMTGVYPDAMALIGGDLNWTFQFTAAPWARAQDMVRTAQADGMITVPTPERQRYARFARQPLVEGLGMVIVHATASPRRAEIDRIEAFDDLRPFALVDYIGNGWGNSIWESWPTVERVRDLRTLLRMIATGRADLAVQPKSVVEVVARQAGVEGQIAYRPATFADRGSSAVHFGLRRSFPEMEAHMAAYEEAQARFIARRGVDELMERWS